MATKRNLPHVERRRPIIGITNGVPNATVAEWATWIIRGIMVAGATGVLKLVLTLGDIQIHLALLEQKIDSHGQQLTAIWQRLPHK